MKQVRIGLLLTALVGGLVWVVWGRAAAGGSLLFGLLAVGIQVIAVGVLRPAISAPVKKLAVRWLVGTVMRLAGAGIWAAAVIVDRAAFPPLPTAVGYLGVLIPLLFMETRFLR